MMNEEGDDDNNNDNEEDYKDDTTPKNNVTQLVSSSTITRGQSAVKFGINSAAEFDLEMFKEMNKNNSAFSSDLDLSMKNLHTVEQLIVAFLT